MNDNEMRSLLVDYMGRGFLDNIIALFRQDESLYRFTADLLGNDNIRVRLGATALVEELAGERRNEFRAAVPGLVALLGHDNPTIRGDAAFVLGIIGDGEAKQALQESLKDSHAGVREAAREALEEIG
jgi:HEAT repeat protein